MDARPEDNVPPNQRRRTAARGKAAQPEQTLMPAQAAAVSRTVITGIARATDFIVTSALGMAVYYGYVHPSDPGEAATYLMASMTTAGGVVVTFQVFKLYSIAALRDLAAQVGRMIGAWSIVFGFLMLAVFLSKSGSDFSRVWLSTWYVAGIGVLSVLRGIGAVMLRRWTRQGRLERRAVIVGGGKLAANLIAAIKASADSDVTICGIFDDRSDARSPATVAGYKKLGTVRQLVDFARRTRIDLLIVSLPISAERRVLQMLKTLWVLPVDIRLSAHSGALRFRPRAYSYVGNVPFIDIFDRPIADWDYVAKTLFDRILGTLLFVALLPVMAIVAIAIKLDSKGPVLFRQNRYGFNNELIGVYKFRSMYVAASDATAKKLVTRDDPRVTSVGRFIRKTSLDELPQLFNVMCGELSLVGPRPHAMHAKAKNALYDQVVDGYFARHRVKPGITGWAQINGWRGETDTKEKIQRRVEHDLFYIENWSVLFDLYILARTPISLLLQKENAY